MGNVHGRVTFAAVLVAHGALFLLLAIGLRPRVVVTEPDLIVAPVYLADLRRKPRPLRQAERPPVRSVASRPPVLSRPVETAGPPIPGIPAPPPAMGASSTDGDGERLALSRALRGGRVGCANPTLLTEAEQLHCQDRLEQGSKLAKYIPTPIPAERRAYYDAVAKAKQPFYVDPRRPGEHPVPSPKVAGSSLAALQSANEKVRVPLAGCKLAFGGPKGTGGWRRPPNSLKLGPLPCYVSPPAGSLSPDAHIQNPDKVIRDPKKAAGEF
jgi:hypothetical protein